MNDAVTKLAAIDRSDEARSYIDRAPHILALIRNRMLDVDASWQRHRSELVHRFKDELTRIDDKHSQDVARLADMERRVEAMRQGD